MSLGMPMGHWTVRTPTKDIAGMGLFYRKFQAGTRATSGSFALVLRTVGTHVQVPGFVHVPGTLNEWDSSGRQRRMLFKGTGDELASTSPEVLGGGAAAITFVTSMTLSWRPRGRTANLRPCTWRSTPVGARGQLKGIPLIGRVRPGAPSVLAGPDGRSVVLGRINLPDQSAPS